MVINQELAEARERDKRINETHNSNESLDASADTAADFRAAGEELAEDRQLGEQRRSVRRTNDRNRRHWNRLRLFGRWRRSYRRFNWCRCLYRGRRFNDRGYWCRRIDGRGLRFRLRSRCRRRDIFGCVLMPGSSITVEDIEIKRAPPVR